MKKIKINFVDFWSGFNKENNYFINLLREKYDVEICSDPEYLIYSCFGMSYLNYDCIRIFFTGENVRPDFNLCDYALGFDWLSFGDRYMRLPLYNLFYSDFEKAKNKHKLSDEVLYEKENFCNFIYSNGKADPTRERFFHLLNGYKKVDSGGRLLNNIGYLVDNKFEFQKRYKFSIAFENSSTIGYTTEKIVQAFSAGTIPIYWGNPLISKEFNTKSFIDCHEYNSLDDVVRRIIEIDNNPELFKQVLREPLFCHENICNITEKSHVLNFFHNIFSQSLPQAIRRNRYFQGKGYEENISLIKEIKSSICLKSLVAIKRRIQNDEKLGCFGKQ